MLRNSFRCLRTTKQLYSTQHATQQFLQELQQRQVIFQQTESLAAVLSQTPNGIYAGFDPTNDGLHVGNLLVLTTMKRFHQAGFPVTAIVGGATGLVGDPRKSERPLLTHDQVQHNMQAIQAEMERYLQVRVLNNADWLCSMNVVDFLRDVGKHFHINVMTKLDSVKSRLEHNVNEEGMTFTEFTYSLFQSYDFYHLYKHHNVNVQIGGSDQYGNIISGIDFIKRKMGNKAKAAGLTIPLLTTSDGKKFGKSEGNALFLNRNKTSPFDFYQYFVRVTDQDACKFLRMLTFLPCEQVAQVEQDHGKAPEQRMAQKLLAQEMTRMIHGDTELHKVQTAVQFLYDQSDTTSTTTTMDWSTLHAQDIQAILKDAPSSTLSRAFVTSNPIAHVCKECNMFKSLNDARRMIKAGALYVNNRREDNDKTVLTSNDIMNDQLVLLRSGKKNYHLLKIIE